MTLPLAAEFLPDISLHQPPLMTSLLPPVMEMLPKSSHCLNSKDVTFAQHNIAIAFATFNEPLKGLLTVLLAPPPQIKTQVVSPQDMDKTDKIYIYRKKYPFGRSPF